MGRISWNSAAQFNWVFDNTGGTPLQEAVAGRWSMPELTVAADGRIYLQPPASGAGQVYWVRGVWRAETVFPWAGFWAEPESGDGCNYFHGGGWENVGTQSCISLGTPLAPGTAVQVYYIYLTGEKAAQYEALNAYPCIRRAVRGRTDFSYDFAVDRILDLMATLHLAGQARGQDYRERQDFLWQSFLPRQASLTSPLVLDTFERSQWDRGAYLLYCGSTRGQEGFHTFAIELDTGQGNDAAPEDPERSRVLSADLITAANGQAEANFAAWWGYALNWRRTEEPFNRMTAVKLKVRSARATARVGQVNNYPAGGSATLRVEDGGCSAEVLDYHLVVSQGGEVGTARFTLYVWDMWGQLQAEYTNLTTARIDNPVWLSEGLRLWWETASGSWLAAGDAWTFRTVGPEYYPRRLLVTLNDSEPADADPWGPSHTYVHALPDRFAELTPLTLDFSQFWRTDNLIDDRDRRRGQWGSWYVVNGGGAGTILFNDREETVTFEDKTFYTQQQVTWDLPGNTLAFGVWVGIDPAQVLSGGQTDINFALQPRLSQGNTLTVRVKVKDAQGSYFACDKTVLNQTWNRVRIGFEEFWLESGSGPLTHPLQAVDMGMVGSPPPLDGSWLIADLKFGDHRTFLGTERIRLLEFKYLEQPLAVAAPNIWQMDDVGLDLEAEDSYPYAPRLAMSLGPYGLNAWRGPTLVHYAHPLGPWLMNRYDLVSTYLRFHRDAQAEYHRRAGGLPGPILPVHTRNDIETIALCGEENFGKFCWWPRYRDGGTLAAAWHFNESLADGSGRGHDLTMSAGEAFYTTGLSQPGQTAVQLAGEGYLSHADNDDLNPGEGDFTLEMVVQMEAPMETALVQKWDGMRGYRLAMTPAGHITAAVSDGLETVTCTGTTNLADGAPHHVALSFTAGAAPALLLMVDGEAVGEAGGTMALGAITTSAELKIGG